MDRALLNLKAALLAGCPLADGAIPPGLPPTSASDREVVWIKAQLRPGESLRDFLPPPTRRVIQRPEQRKPLDLPTPVVLGLAALGLAVLPLLAGAAFTVVLLVIPVLAIRARIRGDRPWAPPRELVPLRPPSTDHLFRARTSRRKR